jgi:hypothetical protein
MCFRRFWKNTGPREKLNEKPFPVLCFIRSFKLCVVALGAGRHQRKQSPCPLLRVEGCMRFSMTATLVFALCG